MTALAVDADGDVLLLILLSWKIFASASVTAPAFMTWPSMMVCGGSGAYPQRTSCSLLRASLSCTTLIELAPMSTPTRFLPSAMTDRVLRRDPGEGGPRNDTSVAPGRTTRQKRRLRPGPRVAVWDCPPPPETAPNPMLPWPPPSLFADVADVTRGPRGHTIEAIAHRYHVTVKAIVEANHLKEPKHLKLGQVLVIPGVDGPPKGKHERGEKARKGRRSAKGGIDHGTASPGHRDARG